MTSDDGDAAMRTAAAKAREFVGFLKSRKIMARYDAVYNGQFARLIIEGHNKKTAGLVDIYNTRNRPCAPYFHQFSDEKTKDTLEELWQECRE